MPDVSGQEARCPMCKEPRGRRPGILDRGTERMRRCTHPFHAPPEPPPECEECGDLGWVRESDGSTYGYRDKVPCPSCSAPVGEPPEAGEPAD